MTAQETTRLWPGGRRARPRQRCADDLPAMRLITRGHWRALAACQQLSLVGEEPTPARAMPGPTGRVRSGSHETEPLPSKLSATRAGHQG